MCIFAIGYIGCIIPIFSDKGLSVIRLGGEMGGKIINPKISKAYENKSINLFAGHAGRLCAARPGVADALLGEFRGWH